MKRIRSRTAIAVLAGATACFAGAVAGQNAAGQFKPPEMKMDRAMMSAKGSDTDVVFARKMLSHHQGAIDMSRVELTNGRDPDLKAMAQKTIDENARGQRELRRWLRSHGG